MMWRRPMLWGRFSLLGSAAAAITCVLDQASKLWLLFVYDLASRGSVKILPVIDFVLIWNTGISYGLFQQDGTFGRFALLTIKLAAVALLWLWLAGVGSRLTALALGLIIGGAIGNIIDRLAYGAVADFVLFHLTTPSFSFNWYVFNLADTAIVAGVLGLLYDTLFGSDAAKAP